MGSKYFCGGYKIFFCGGYKFFLSGYKKQVFFGPTSLMGQNFLICLGSGPMGLTKNEEICREVLEKKLYWPREGDKRNPMFFPNIRRVSVPKFHNVPVFFQN